MEDRHDLDARGGLPKPALVRAGDGHDSLRQGGELRSARVCRVVGSNHRREIGVHGLHLGANEGESSRQGHQQE